MNAAAGGAPPRAIPHYFGPDDRRCLGWRHLPAPSAAPRSVAVVLCAASGYESLTTYRSVRHLAERLALSGHPVQRFDYDGTGDSAGDDGDPGRWQAWIRSAGAAADELRVRTGADRVVFVGIRLGALIAAVASRGRNDVAGLAVIAPVAEGKRFLREAKALAGAMGRPEAPAEWRLPEGTLESAGMVIDADSQRAMQEIRLADGPFPPAVLVIDREDRPPHDALVQAIAGAGAAVEHAVIPGYVQMTLDPHDAVVPEAILGRVDTWMDALAGRAAGPRTADAGGQAVALVAPGVQESLEFLDAERRRFGIVSRPVGATPTRALLLLNSGAIHRVANARLYVTLARRLASRGWLVLRYDLSGIGDSVAYPDAEENDVYSRHAVEDLGLAIAHLRERHGVTHVEALGLCSGAYHAFKGAVAGLPLDGIFVVNPLVFFWKQGMSLAYPPFEMVNAAARYRAAARDPRKWLKLLSGRVDVSAAVQTAAHRAGARTRALARESARALRIPIRDDLAAELRAVADRGTTLRFVFSEGDPGEILLTEGAGRTAGSLIASGRVSCDRLESCDHSLTVRWMHERLWQVLQSRLGP